MTAIHSAGAITSHIDNPLERKTSTIHFVIQPDDRRPAIVPRQAGVSCVTLDDLIGKEWVEVARVRSGSQWQRSRKTDTPYPQLGDASP